jgi:hypothetical protein
MLADRVVPERQSKQFDILLRNITLSSNSFDLDLPAEVDDEYWENDDAALAFQQPPGKPALVASFNTFIKLSQIMAFALITLVSKAIYFLMRCNQ